jgi:crotonobetainyl-CoA:carnitine CoA-transferase CaiB-like acyl-CoA transferase
MVPALVGHPVTDPWAAVTRFASSRRSEAVADEAQALGVPAAALDAADDARLRARRLGAPATRGRTLLVVDLSAMWAGPVVAQVLGWAGARVVKVESRSRPDGTRRGPPAFFDWLHAGHESAAWDFTTRDGAARLRALVDEADVVIEASRPRALRQLGLDAEELVATRAGRTWVSITAAGRGGAASHRVGFGDEVAVGAGLVAYDDLGHPVFCGDAIADPITGLVAALATTSAVAAGGGYLLDVPMAAAARFVAQPAAWAPAHQVVPAGPGRWAVTHGAARHEILDPQPPRPARRAEPLGASTAAVLAEFTAGAVG